MKVAIMLLNEGRGSGVVARDHSRHLIRHGHHVHLIYPNIGDGVEGANNVKVDIGRKTVPVHEYLPSAESNQKPVYSMGHMEVMEFVEDYKNALERVIEDTDIVVGHHANLTAIACAEVCKKFNKPYVLFLHGTGVEPRHHGFFDDAVWEEIENAINGAKGLIVTTRYVRDELVRKMVDIPKDKFLLLPCGVDPLEFHPKNTHGILEKYGLNGPYVICPGALIQSKGPQNVVEASKEYSDLAETIFIGDGDLRQDLEQELGNRGRFLGFVPKDDKAKLINAASLLIAAPEKKEHFGIIYAEALAAGVPITAYEGGGVNTIVNDETGILTKRDPSALGKSVRDLLQNDKRRAQMATHCRKRSSKYFTNQAVIPKLIHWLSDITKTNRVMT